MSSCLCLVVYAVVVKSFTVLVSFAVCIHGMNLYCKKLCCLQSSGNASYPHFVLFHLYDRSPEAVKAAHAIHASLVMAQDKRREVMKELNAPQVLRIVLYFD